MSMPTWVGRVLPVPGPLVPRPSWPLLLLPQAQSVPSARTARPKSLPAAVLRVGRAVPVAVGVGLAVPVPKLVALPSWPYWFSPMASRLPSARKASVCR